VPDGLWGSVRLATPHTATVTRPSSIALPGAAPPLGRSLERLNARDMWLQARIAPAPDDGWLRADRIATNPEVIDALWTVAHGATGGADRGASAS
jgi:hypothetical protein